MINQKVLGGVLITFSVLLIILLTLVKADMDKKDAFLCDVVHSNPESDVQACPVHTSRSSWLLFMSFGVSFVTLASGLYMMFAHAKQKVQEVSFKEVDTSVLGEDEKKVYELLREHQGSMYQSDVIKKTGFSKVQVTRILDRLESLGCVERRRRGMTNIIVVR